MHRMPAEPDWAHSTSASYEKAGWNAGDTTATLGETVSLQTAGDLHKTWAHPPGKDDL